ncbi:MAG: PQQ-binding-like beta-propeller repeat protein, partial [Candidatus Hydrogenedentes bacterium]|nr:PQQ-binding-like beta-propeller repeat protein [Candidatus Hydrogenedentota bacterium]
MRLILGLTLLASFLAAGLEEVWRYDLGCGLPHLPVVMSYEGQPGSCVYVASRLSNTIEVLSGVGREVATFTRPRRIAGGIACNSVLDQLLFEEGDGSLVLFNRQRPENFVAEGETLTGGVGEAQLAFADLDGDDLPEVLIAGGEGTLCVYDRKMAPQWQYDTGQPLSGGIAAGPVFGNGGGVYLVCRDGSVHAVGGAGEPLWRRELPPRGFTRGNHRRVLVLEREGRGSLVIVADATGSVYALGAADGELEWRVRVGGTDAGTPAVVGGRVVVLCEDGGYVALTDSGEVVSRGALPEGLYVPRPLAGDVDGDGGEELVAATMDRRVVVASLDGGVKETVSLPGNASQGLVLSDIDEDGLLELITVTDCGRVICHKTRAHDGWTHPAGNPEMNGYVPRRGPSGIRGESPEQKRARRSARVQSVTIRDFVEESPFGAAFVRARATRKTETASAVIRCNGRVVGSTRKRMDRDGFYVPFVQTSSEPLTLDLNLYNNEGRVVASSSDIPIASGPVRLVNLTPIDEFLQAVTSRADAFVTPRDWSVPDRVESIGGNGNSANVAAGTYCEAGG